MVREANPTVWVLTDDRPGNNSQSIGLAEALGWPYEKKPLQFYRFARFLARLPNGLLLRAAKVVEFTDSDSVIQWLLQNLSETDVALLKGSHGLRMDRIVAAVELQS